MQTITVAANRSNVSSSLLLLLLLLMLSIPCIHEQHNATPTIFFPQLFLLHFRGGKNCSNSQEMYAESFKQQKDH